MSAMYCLRRTAAAVAFLGLVLNCSVWAQDPPPPKNQPPTVKLVSPLDGQVFLAPANIVLMAAPFDPDGVVVSVEFFANGRSLGVVAPDPRGMGPMNPYRFEWKDVPAGNYELTVKALDDAGADGTSDPVKIHVLERAFPVVTLTVPDPVATEQSPFLDSIPDMARFVVSRTGGTAEPLTVAYRIEGTAFNGTDYGTPDKVPLSGMVEIPAQETRVEVLVFAIDDDLVEPEETVLLALAMPAVDPATGVAPYVIGRPSTGKIVIRDDDTPPPPNQPPSVRIVSPPNGAVLLSPESVTIIAGARDPDGFVTQVEFFVDGQSIGVVAPEPFDRIVPMDASHPEWGPVHPFVIRWSDPTPGTHVLHAVAKDNQDAETKSAPVEIKILELTTPPIVTVVASDPEGAEVATDPTSTGEVPELNPAQFTIRRTGSTAAPLEVYFRLEGTAENGVDYEKIVGSVVIPEEAASAAVDIRVLDDLIAEGSESVVLILLPPPVLEPEPPTGEDPAEVAAYWVGRQSRARAVIYDNDGPPNLPPLVQLVHPRPGEVFPASATISLIALAGDLDGQVVSVEFFEGENSLGLGTPGSTDPQVYSAVWENVPAGEYVLTAVATDDDGAKKTSRPISIKVVELQLPPVVTVEATDDVAREHPADAAIPPDPAIFTVRRTGPTEHALTVHYRLDGKALNGIDYDLLPRTVTIPEGATSADILVKPIDDLLVEGDESVVITLVPARCVPIFPPVPECYVVGEPRMAKAVILDDDVAPPHLRIQIVRPEAGDVFPLGEPIQLVAAVNWDAQVAKVEFFDGDILIGEGKPLPEPILGAQHFGMMWEGASAGEHKLRAQVTDVAGVVAVSDPVPITVLDHPPLPVVTIFATDPVASEPGVLTVIDTATFTLRRTGNAELPLAVWFAIGGEAENGVDYAKIESPVTFKAGQETATIVIDALLDKAIEAPETVVIELLPPQPVSPTGPILLSYVVGRPSMARAIIKDPEWTHPIPPKIAITQPRNGQLFRAPADIEITAVTVDPDGYVPKVEFFAGDKLIGTVPFAFLVEPQPGEEQTASFKWEAVPAGCYMLYARATDNLGNTGRSLPVGVVVVPVGLPPIVTVVAVDPVGAEPTPAGEVDNAVFVVHRTGDLSEELKVAYKIGGTAQNGVDYTELTGEVILPAEADSARLVVEPLADNLVEGTESVVIELDDQAWIGIYPPPPGCFRVGDLRRASAKILDRNEPVNRPPMIEIVKPTPGTMFQVPAEIPIVAAGVDPDGRIVKVEFFADGEKIGELPGVDPATGRLDSDRQAFTYTWVGAEAGEHLLTVKAWDDDGADALSREVPIRVIEGTLPPIVNVVATDPFAVERPDTLPANTATFKLRRTGSTAEALMVWIEMSGTAGNGVDYTEIVGTVTIPKGKRNVRVTVSPIDDELVERVETVVLTVVPAPLGAPIEPYRIGWPAQACAVIVDNDHESPNVRPLPEHRCEIALPGESGLPYRIEASDDLAHWFPVIDTIAEDGKVRVVDSEAATLKHRFYRVRPVVVEAIELDD